MKPELRLFQWQRNGLHQTLGFAGLVCNESLVAKLMGGTDVGIGKLREQSIDQGQVTSRILEAICTMKAMRHVVRHHRGQHVEWVAPNKDYWGTWKCQSQ